MKCITRFCVVVCAVAVPGFSQPTRPEVFAYVGGLRAAGDEGSLGAGFIYGGDILVPFYRRLALNIDAATAKTRRSSGGDEFHLRRTFLGVSLVGRWGNERTYFFAGGGLGIEHSRGRTIASTFLPGIRPPGAEEIAPGVFQFRSSETNPALIGRAGFVHTVWRRALLRFDLLWSQQHALPNIGGRVGVGYRF